MVLVFLCFNLLVFSATAFAGDYYVSPNGSDSNDGSQARPWRTISHADAALTVGASTTCSAASGWYSQPGYGACVHIAPGTYSIGSELITNKSGASSNQRVGFCFRHPLGGPGSTEFRRIFRHLFGPRRMVGHYRI